VTQRTRSAEPGVSVVVPTYNRCELLGHTLDALAAQRPGGQDFEVIVADDGSSDATGQVASSFADRLRLRYFFQEDQGYRVARVRNRGARMAAAPVLVFIDAGVRPGPDFVLAHLDAHRGVTGVTGAGSVTGSVAGDTSQGARGRLVVGYTYGYNPYDPCPGLADMLARYGPADVVRAMDGTPSFRDLRHDAFAAVGFELNAMAVPWMHCWSVNLSVSAADFWAVGGFDEDFRSWGGEDLDLGYRLTRHGVPMALSRAAWAIETPHDRDLEANNDSSFGNAMLFLAKNPEPVVELFWGIYGHGRWDPPLEYEYGQLTAWQRQARDLDVLGELDAATRQSAAARGRARVAVFGCGGRVPSWWASSGSEFVLADFDPELLDRAAGGRYRRLHAIGLRVAEPESSFDLVVITSRLAGLWHRWEALLRDEANRIGRSLWVAPIADDPADPRPMPADGRLAQPSS